MDPEWEYFLGKLIELWLCIATVVTVHTFMRAAGC